MEFSESQLLGPGHQIKRNIKITIMRIIKDRNALV